MAFVEIAGKLLKGVTKVAQKWGGAAVDAIKRGIANRKDKKAAKRAGLDPVQGSTQELIEGSSKYYRDLISKQKDKARAIEKKISVYKKLVAAGASESEARTQVNLTLAELETPAEFFLGTGGETSGMEPEATLPPVNKGCLTTTIIILSTFASFVAALILILIKL